MQRGISAAGLGSAGQKRPYDGVENPKEPPKRQNLSEHGVPTRVVQNQDLVGGAHNPVSALNDIINVDSGPNPGQVAVDVSGLMSDVDPSRPNGGENGLALSGPNVDMRQITPLIDAWFGRFEVSLPGELSATLKKALDEKSKCDAMSLTTGKSDETLRKIWKNKDFYKSMIDKMSALKQSSQQFDDSLALGLLFHMIVYASTIEFNALSVDQLQFQKTFTAEIQSRPSLFSFGFFSSEKNSFILRAAQQSYFSSKAVFIGCNDWFEPASGSKTDGVKGTIISLSKGGVSFVSSIEDSRKYRAVIYSGVLFQQNGDRLTGTFKFSNPDFLPGGNSTTLKIMKKTSNGADVAHILCGQFSSNGSKLDGTYCVSKPGQDGSQIIFKGTMRLPPGKPYLPNGLCEVQLTKELSVIGHWKDGKLKEPENPSSMHVLKNNSTRETLRGNFSDLSVMFSCDNHLAFIPSLNKGFATVFLKEGIQISDNNRLQLMYASEERPPISSAALRSFQVEFVGDEINDFEFKFDPFSHKYYATFLLDLLSKGHIKMSFNVYLALKYLSEGRPPINFKSVKLNFKDNELQGFVFRDVDDAKNYSKFLLECLSEGHIKMSFKVEMILKYQSEGRPLINFNQIDFEFDGNKLISFRFASKNFSRFLLESCKVGFINMDEKAKGILEKMVADEPAGGAVGRPGAAPPPPRPAAAQVRPGAALPPPRPAAAQVRPGAAPRHSQMPRPAGGAAAVGAGGRPMGAMQRGPAGGVLVRPGAAPGPAGGVAGRPSQMPAQARPAGGAVGRPTGAMQPGPQMPRPAGGAAAGGVAARPPQMRAQASPEQLSAEFARLCSAIIGSESNDLKPLKEMVAFYNDNRSEFDRNLHFTYVYNMLLYKKLFVLSEKLIKKQLAMTETIRSDLKVFINPQIIGQHCQSWQEFLRYVNHGINENETINFRKFIADNCKGSEIVKMLEEIKGKITQGQLTEEDRSNFKVLNHQGFRSFLASKNSEHAHPLPYVHQLNAELIHVEQLLKQYDSVPDARQNPVRRGDFVVPYKIDKDCSNRIFIRLQKKGLIKAEMLDVQRHDYLDKLKDEFYGSDLSQYLGDIQLIVAQILAAQNLGKKCTLTTESFVTEGRPNTEEDQTIFDLLIHHKILDKDGNLLLKNDQEVDQRVSVLPSEVNHYASHIKGVLKQKLIGGVIEGGRIVID